jgi:hypothetical protein
MTWDATNSRLGIGTNAPASPINVKLNQNNATFIKIENGTNGTASWAGLQMESNVSGDLFNIFKTSQLYTTYKTIVATDVGFYKNGLGDFSFLNDNAAGNIKFTSGASSTAQMTLHSTGNLLLGSTSNSGERLQVTGTAKITTSLDIAGGKVFSAYNSGGTANDALKIAASNLGATFGVQNTNAGGFSGVEYINNSGTVQVFTGFNNNNNQEFRFNNIASGGYIDFLISSTSALRIFNNRSVSINSNTDIASAQFQITSTTKGFLPPRMTTTQKNAITSPAAGLVVYDTTLNKLCVYTTAWETITSI